MPICPRCKMAFLDGESHRCPPKSHPAAFVLGFIVVIYAGSAFALGSPFLPPMAVGYFGYIFVRWLAYVIGQLLANVIHALG